MVDLGCKNLKKKVIIQNDGKCQFKLKVNINFRSTAPVAILENSRVRLEKIEKYRAGNHIAKWRKAAIQT